ncbi:hypothetical protein BVC80_773g16 [Macleaya cordata]|uniref:Uncharacterized protein n=1 Tax=Macleaya cordata TaxID=56857 RepID=A0A200R0V7_MACCD|nr:hypothetical protein BVC80_773g16 [Macleaya cordata]
MKIKAFLYPPKSIKKSLLLHHHPPPSPAPLQLNTPQQLSDLGLRFIQEWQQIDEFIISQHR